MKYLLRTLAGLGSVFLLGAIFVLAQFSRRSEARFERPRFDIHEEVLRADVELGRRIYHVRNGCVECHGANLAGAKVIDAPAMGTIHGANITPYKLKNWSDEEIATAIRYGVRKDSRSLRFMPSFDYQELSKGDVAAVIAYLRSVPEVQAESHENSYGPLARTLSVIGQMPVMFPAYAIAQDRGFAAKPPEGPTAEFGRYLASSCVGCHGAELRGGPIPGGDPSWPPAANIRLGEGNGWTEARFLDVIRTGVSALHGQPVRAPMPVALLRQLDDKELKALWLYLSSLH